MTANIKDDLFYDGWSEYQISKVSPEIVGNTDLEGIQCHSPFDIDCPLCVFPMPVLIESEYVDLDRGAYTELLYDGAVFDVNACCKLEDEFGSVKQSGYSSMDSGCSGRRRCCLDDGTMSIKARSERKSVRRAPF